MGDQIAPSKIRSIQSVQSGPICSPHSCNSTLDKSVPNFHHAAEEVKTGRTKTLNGVSVDPEPPRKYEARKSQHPPIQSPVGEVGLRPANKCPPLNGIGIWIAAPTPDLFPSLIQRRQVSPPARIPTKAALPVPTRLLHQDLDTSASAGLLISRMGPAAVIRLEKPSLRGKGGIDVGPNCTHQKAPPTWRGVRLSFRLLLNCPMPRRVPTEPPPTHLRDHASVRRGRLEAAGPRRPLRIGPEAPPGARISEG